jgi:hypothetical protein
MSIPSDLEAKLASTRQKIGALIEQWTRLCSTAERILKRREAAAGELARVMMTMNALAEGNQNDPWGNVGDELASGVNWCPECRRVPWSAGRCNGGAVEDRYRGESGGFEGAAFHLLDTVDLSRRRADSD